jgi:hypothetical protein
MRDETQDEANARVTGAARKVGEGISELGRALSERRDDLAEPMSRFIQERPVAALGIAFGVGYLLGGGLFSKTTARLVGVGWKLGGMALAKELLGGLATEAADRL